MQEAARKQPRALEKLKHAGLAYVEFALRRPEHFAVMFDAPLRVERHHDSNDAAKEAFSTLVGLVRAAQGDGELASGDALKYAYLAWTMVHGVAKLAITGRLPYRAKSGIMKFALFVIEQSLPAR